MTKDRIKDIAANGFVAFEAAMHVYLLVYLTFNWTNLLIWGFTAFELSMFIFLIIHKRGDRSAEVKEAARCCCSLPRVSRGLHKLSSRANHGHPH